MLRKKSPYFLIQIMILFTALLFLSNGCLNEPDSGPPAVTILNPGNNDVVTGIVPIVVTASDDKDIRNLKLLIDGQEVVSENNDMLTYQWDTSNILDNLNHVISAYAVDDDENIGAAAVVTVQVTDVPLIGELPTVNFVFPDPNANNVFSKSDTTMIQAVVDANDDKRVEKVEFYIDGNLVSTVTDADPLYRYNWNIANEQSNIDHTIYVIAYDTDGNIAAALAAVNIVD